MGINTSLHNKTNNMNNSNTNTNEGSKRKLVCVSNKKLNNENNKNNKLIEGLVKDIIYKADEPHEVPQEVLKDNKTYLNKINKLKRNKFPKSSIFQKLNSNSILEVANEISSVMTRQLSNRESNCNLYDSYSFYTDLHKFYHKALSNWNEKLSYLNPPNALPDIIDLNEASNIIDSSKSYDTSDFFNSSKNSGLNSEEKQNSTKKLNKSKSFINSPMGKKIKQAKINDKNKLKTTSRGKFLAGDKSNVFIKFGSGQSKPSKLSKSFNKNESRIIMNRTNKFISSNIEPSFHKNNGKMIKNFNTNKYAKKYYLEMEKKRNRSRNKNFSLKETKSKETKATIYRKYIPYYSKNTEKEIEEEINNKKKKNIKKDPIISIDIRTLKTEESLNNIDIPSNMLNTLEDKLKKGSNKSLEMFNSTSSIPMVKLHLKKR